MDVFERGEGSLHIRLEVESTRGRGICAFVTGGDSPHVGGVAVAIPRKKSNADDLTCDVSQICLPNHKDVYAAVEVAKVLALATRESVSVTAGIHMDGADKEQIAQLMDNAKDCAADWAASYVAPRERS